jgi:hypothetical protein
MELGGTAAREGASHSRRTPMLPTRPCQPMVVTERMGTLSRVTTRVFIPRAGRDRLVAVRRRSPPCPEARHLEERARVTVVYGVPGKNRTTTNELGIRGPLSVAPPGFNDAWPLGLGTLTTTPDAARRQIPTAILTPCFSTRRSGTLSRVRTPRLASRVGLRLAAAAACPGNPATYRASASLLTGLRGWRNVSVKRHRCLRCAAWPQSASSASKRRTSCWVARPYRIASAHRFSV